MSSQFTETTRTSWFGRIKRAFTGIVMGVVLVLGSIGVLFWNEGRAVKTANALHEGAGLVQTIDPRSVSAGASGRLVHFTGNLQPSGRASDPLFSGISAPDGAIRLEREVQMYQWHEKRETRTKTNVGGSEETVTTYSYAKKWSERQIDSSRFKRPSGHENPRMPARSETFGVPSGSVGQIQLEGKQFSNLGDATAMGLDDRVVNIVRGQFADGRDVARNANTILVRSSSGGDTVGDLRIRFLSADVDVISVVGQLNGDRIVPFTASNGRKISMFDEGSLSAKQMFDDALATNTMWTWLIRLGGFIAMFVGFKLIFSVVGVLGDIIPFIGDVFRFATGIAAFALAAMISTIIIAIAWFYYRPLLSIGIIVVGGAITAGAFYLGKGRARAQTRAA